MEKITLVCSEVLKAREHSWRLWMLAVMMAVEFLQTANGQHASGQHASGGPSPNSAFHSTNNNIPRFDPAANLDNFMIRYVNFIKVQYFGMNQQNDSNAERKI